MMEIPYDPHDQNAVTRCYKWGERDATICDIEDEACPACEYVYTRLQPSTASGGVIFIGMEREGQEPEFRRIEILSRTPLCVICKKISEVDILREMIDARARREGR
jgi:hypothetical protein